jgi:MFS family permease
LGAGRFAYALVLPAMQAQLGLTFAQAGLLGSANTVGYLIGALVSHRVLAAVGYRRGFYASLILGSVSLLLLALSPGFALFVLLRLVQGVFGAFVFVGGAALLMASGSRSTGLGVYFGGAGLGIVLSTLILPLMSDWETGWLLLGLLSLALTSVSFLAVPRLREPPRHVVSTEGSLRGVTLAMVVYGLYGAGYIGYMTFVGAGLDVPLGKVWVILGVGAALNGYVWGPVVERVGGVRALRLIMVSLTVASLFPLLVHLPYVSAFLFGISFLGVITAITALFRERLPAPSWSRAMGLSTAIFAVGQAVGPSVSGLAGELLGGAAGALWSATTLLGTALIVALLSRDRRGARDGRATGVR